MRHGHVAVVTGGSRGLGKGIALELASAGAETISKKQQSFFLAGYL
jgi:NAD(P)-dependent dehydrogenase (short-subunit alcohol dehydrogenase family)